MNGLLEARLIAAAGPQRGLLTVWQLGRLGVGRDLIIARLRSGAWVRLQRAVYKLTPGDPDIDQRELAALLAAGHLAVLSHQTAARRLKLDGELPDLVHLTMPIPFKAEGLIGVKVWRTHELTEAQIVRRGLFRYTSIGRTVLDLSGVVDATELRIAGDSCLRRNPANLNCLWLALKGHGAGRPGAAALRSLLEEYELDAPVSDSALESMAMELGFFTGRKPVLHYRFVPGKKFGPHLDFAWPELKFGVELDGWRDHCHRSAFERDREKDRRAFLLGWGTMRFTWLQVRREPLAFIQQVAAGYRLRAQQQGQQLAAAP